VANRLSRRIEENERDGRTIIDLTESNPTRCGFRYEGEAILRGIADASSLTYAPHPQGLPTAREAIAGFYREQGVSTGPDALFLTSGTSEAYSFLFKLLADPGDEILVPVPGYPLLEVLTRLDSVRIVHYPLRCGVGGRWSVDLDGLAHCVTARTRAIVAVSPNNPTGSFLKHDELAAMTMLCQRHDIALIVDEVFSDYGQGSDPSRVTTAAGDAAALIFVLNGFSKMLGLPQVKLSWIHVSGPVSVRSQACARLGFVTDAYLSVGAPVMNAAPSLLRGRAALQRQVRQRLETNDEQLRRQQGPAGGIEVLGREGGWYAVVRLPEGLGDEEVALELVDREGVLVHPGFFYDFPTGGQLVLSLLLPTDMFREGVSRLVSCVQRMRAGVR
jgi:hypothetical protein